MKQKNKRDVFSFLNENLVFDEKRDHHLVKERIEKHFDKFHEVQGKIDVIIIEDDSDMSKLMQKFFEQNNLSSFVLDNVEEAIELFSAKHPFLVTVDLSLTGSSGHKFLDFIQTLKTEQKPWVAIVSGAKPIEIDDALFEGGDFYFSKPVNFKELKVLLDRINDKRNLA